MTTKDNIRRELDRFGYNYAERDQELEVRLGFNLTTTIDLSQEGRVLLTDRLQGCNLLSGLVPTKDVDEFWHQHIMDTRAYAQDCEEALGHFLHHFPYMGMRGEEDARQLETAFRRTERLHREAFGEELMPGGMNQCWHDCSGRCWNECSSK